MATLPIFSQQIQKVDEIKIYLDDMRKEPIDWQLAKTAEEAISKAIAT
jgi:hypothetical protein